MLIRIPPHIKDLPIIQDLSNMILEYSKNVVIEEDSFEYFFNEFSKDSVRYFLEIIQRCNINGTQPKWDQTYMNYLAEMLYSAKGTPMVFTFISKYIFPSFNWEYSPFSKCLKISLSEINVKDVDYSTVLKSIKDLATELLFFEDLKTYVESVYQEIKGELSQKISLGGIFINYINAEIIPNEN